MSRLHTHKIATMTEMREPQKVLEKSGGAPVAVLRNSQVVGYFVPAEAFDKINVIPATDEALMQALDETEAVAAPVQDYLKDK